MAAYRRVYDSRHLQADCQNRDQLRNTTLGNRVWATSYLFTHGWVISNAVQVYMTPRAEQDLVGGPNLVRYTHGPFSGTTRVSRY